MYTQAELHEIAREVASILRQNSKSVGDVPKVSTLDGILTLPALRFNAGVPEVVEAPVSALQKVATDAVAEAVNDANAAAKGARDAASAAGTAKQGADSAASDARSAARDANTAKVGADAAAEAARTAKSDADLATANANRQAELAAAAAALAEATASTNSQSARDALEAAARALAAAATSEAEIAEMEELEASISGATSMSPNQMLLSYPAKITLRNPYVQKIVAALLPSYVRQNVLFLGDDAAVSVSPDGTVTPLKQGTSKIHVIPTQATHLYKTISIEVQAPAIRLTASGTIRLDSKGRIRLT